MQEFAVSLEAVDDLARQFAGRAEDQHAAGLRLERDAELRKPIEDGQREGCGLAGAGLGNTNKVATGQENGNGLRLNWRRRDVFLLDERAVNLLGEAKFTKCGQRKHFL